MRDPRSRCWSVAIASAASSIANASSMRSAMRMPRARPICAWQRSRSSVADLSASSKAAIDSAVAPRSRSTSPCAQASANRSLPSPASANAPFDEAPGAFHVIKRRLRPRRCQIGRRRRGIASPIEMFGVQHRVAMGEPSAARRCISCCCALSSEP